MVAPNLIPAQINVIAVNSATIESTVVSLPFDYPEGTKLGLSSYQIQFLKNMYSEQLIAELKGIVGGTNHTKFRD